MTTDGPPQNRRMGERRKVGGQAACGRNCEYHFRNASSSSLRMLLDVYWTLSLYKSRNLNPVSVPLIPNCWTGRAPKGRGGQPRERGVRANSYGSLLNGRGLHLNPYSLDFADANVIVSAIIEAGGFGIRVAGQALRNFQLSPVNQISVMPVARNCQRRRKNTSVAVQK